MLFNVNLIESMRKIQQNKNERQFKKKAAKNL